MAPDHLYNYQVKLVGLLITQSMIKNLSLLRFVISLLEAVLLVLNRFLDMSVSRFTLC